MTVLVAIVSRTNIWRLKLQGKLPIWQFVFGGHVPSRSGFTTVQRSWYCGISTVQVSHKIRLVSFLKVMLHKLTFNADF